MSSSVLIVGGHGFLGRHIASALQAAGMRVRRAGRGEIDFARDRDAGSWREVLQGIDVVVNAAGIFRERGSNTFEAVHVLGPRALFAACAQAGVKVVQVSALGADEDARSRFHLTKKAGDDALLALGIPAVVLQPSLVYGTDGESARMFTTLASLPLVPLPGAGDQRVQPVHVDDVAAVVVAIVRDDAFDGARIAVVGPAPLTLRRFLAELRAAMGMKPAPFLPVPDVLMKIAASLRLGMLDRDALAMLRRGNTADGATMRRLLGREPRAPREFIGEAEGEAVKLTAQLGWLLPVLRLSIAFIWIAAAIVSAGVYPVQESLALLARTGITGAAAYAALYGAALLDLALGIATLAMRRRRLLWLLQAAVIAGYTAIITFTMPEQWLHPYGPVVKNVPILAAILLLYQLESR